MLADEVEVSTRHITDERGIRFSMRLDLRPSALEIVPIQVNYDANLPIGTTVTLKVNKVNRAKVQKGALGFYTTGEDMYVTPSLWDWYCLKTPSVVRRQGKKRKILKQSATVPAENSVLPPGWHPLQSSDYRTVHALVHGRPGTYAPDLTCNGIKVGGTRTFGGLSVYDPAIIDWQKHLFPRQGVFSLKVPDFSIFDPDGNLPLNLQRTGLTDLRLDFLNEAFAAQAKAALARFVFAAPVDFNLASEFLVTLTDIFMFNEVFPVFFTKNGTALLTPTNLRIAQVRNCLLLSSEAFSEDWLVHLRDRYDAIMVARSVSSRGYSVGDLSPWIADARMLIRSDGEPEGPLPMRFMHKKSSVKGLYVYSTSNCSAGFLTRNDIRILRDKPRPMGTHKRRRGVYDFVAAELFLKPELDPNVPPELSVGHYWEQIIRGPTIPFDPTERRTKLSHAYIALKDYLAHA